MSNSLTKKEVAMGMGDAKFDKVSGLSGDEFLMANALALFVASHDTTNVFIGYLFYEVAVNPDVQQRLKGGN